jgi:hypothetical protein
MNSLGMASVDAEKHRSDIQREIWYALCSAQTLVDHVV